MSTILKYTVLVLCLFYLASCKHRNSLTKSNDSEKEEYISKSLKKKYAEKLGISESEIKNEKLYHFIDDWYGVPYKYGGKEKSGIDCSGLTSVLYSTVYKKNISCSTKALVGEVNKIKQSDLTEGDLVFFNTNGKSISHVGVYLQNNKFVHASTKKGVMISDMKEPYFIKTFVSSGRVK